MTVINASEARANFYKLIDEAAASHEPITIQASVTALF
jgi:PHD/YefM family antitoxin component YafN of YafNO toxin-antitoxin module